MHGLIMHVYSSDHANLIVDHLGLHKAFCILMGWNYRTPPDNSKVYQFLSAEEAAANLSDLIIWPPLVIIHNTNTGKGREGRTEGLGNRAMDNYLRGIYCTFLSLYHLCSALFRGSYEILASSCCILAFLYISLWRSFRTTFLCYTFLVW